MDGSFGAGDILTLAGGGGPLRSMAPPALFGVLLRSRREFVHVCYFCHVCVCWDLCSCVRVVVKLVCLRRSVVRSLARFKPTISMPRLE